MLNRMLCIATVVLLWCSGWQSAWGIEPTATSLMKAYLAAAESVQRLDVCSHSDTLEVPEVLGTVQPQRALVDTRLIMDYQDERFTYVVRTEYEQLGENQEKTTSQLVSICYHDGKLYKKTFGQPLVAKELSFQEAHTEYSIPYVNAAGFVTLFFNNNSPLLDQVGAYAHHFEDFKLTQRLGNTLVFSRNETALFGPPKPQAQMWFDEVKMVPIKSVTSMKSGVNFQHKMNREMEYGEKNGFHYLLKDTMSGVIPSSQNVGGQSVAVQTQRSVDYRWKIIDDEVDFSGWEKLIADEKEAIKFLDISVANKE